MRHRIQTKRLGRFSSLRKATVNSLARAIIINQSIETTQTKAKIAVGLIEHLITLAKKGRLSGKREAYKVLLNHKLVVKLFGEIAGLFKNRQSGFTRVIKLNKRRGDGAQKVILELTEKSVKEKKKVSSDKERAPHREVKENESVEHAQENKSYPVQADKADEGDKKDKPPAKFLGGLRGFFKKERDSL